MTRPFRVDGELAMITGATRGIGRGAAEALAQSGADLILVGRDATELQRVAAALQQYGTRVVAEPFDLLQTEAIAPWCDRICKQHGDPSILVNAAGMQRRGPATDISLSDWNEVLSLNTTAMFELSRCFARPRIAAAKAARVINIASLMTAAARAGTSPYTASKGAVGQLTKVLAVEWAKHNILVNAIAPGYVDTEMNRALVEDAAFSAWVEGRCPLGRWATPEDIAWPIVFLASAASGFITGQTIYVDGGWLATF